VDARAWRIAGGSAAALLGVLALVLWRTDDLAGGWLWALRLTALLAAAGLLTATLLAGRAALAPPARREVVVRLPAGGAPQTEVRPAPAGAAAAAPGLLRTALGVAVVSAAPVLAVLVLASPAADPTPVAAAAPTPAASTSSTATTPPASPSATGEDAAPAPPPAASAATTAPTADPASPGATGPPPTGPPATGPPGQAPEQADPAPAEQAPEGLGPPGTGSAAAPAPASCERTVAEGDSLWGIAAEQLGPTATVAEVAERTRSVYAENAAAVGADPDLIRPGLVIRSCG